MAFKTILLASLLSVAFAAPQQRARNEDFNSFNFEQAIDTFNFRDDIAVTTPIPILRHVDTQNPDGSYTYGYESGDGSYKIETRYATGEVIGKYGYYDDTGRLRQVEYGAAPERGFEPRAEGLIVAPPTIDDPEPVISRPQPAPVASSRPAQPVRATVVRRPRPRPATLQQTFAPVAPQQPTLQAHQRFTPAVAQPQTGPLPSSVSFFNHPYISDYNSQNGVFSYSY